LGIVKPDARTEVLAHARLSAHRRGESRVGTDHLLIGVVIAGNEVARAAGLSAEGLLRALDRLDERALGEFGIDAPGRALSITPGWSRPWRPLPLSAGAKRCLEKGVRVAIDRKERRVNTNHLLAALATGGSNDPATRLLRSCSVEPADLESAVRRALEGGAGG
jgi:ATP-dependent Clp protease ATP-binding subunit ClpA